MPITSTPTFTGTEYIRRPFSYDFSSTITDYPVSIQFTDSSPGLLANTSGNVFSSTTGFQGSPGSAGTLVVDAIGSNSAFSKLFAGSVRGYLDGIGSNAQFNAPNQIAFDGSGNAFICDGLNNRIRKITPDGVVSTFCSTGNLPTGLVIDNSSNLYVSLTSSQRIDKVTPSGVITTLAGSGNPGFTDGTGVAADFFNPQGMAIDLSTNTLFVADTGNNAIRQITSTGVVTTLAGTTGSPGTRDGVVVGLADALVIARSRTDPIFHAFQTNTALSNNSFVTPLSTMSPNMPQGIVYGGGTWVAVGTNYAVSTSSDGDTWVSANTTGIESNLKVDYGNGVYVAVGIKGGGTATAVYSTDLSGAWTDISTIPINGTTISNVRFLDGKFIAMGTDSSGTRAAYSTDGSNWTGISGFAGTTSGRDIAYNGSNLWVSIGDGASIKYASNVTGPWSNINGMTVSNVFSIDYGNGFWVVGGSNGASQSMIEYSSNLTTWTPTVYGNNLSNVSVVRFLPASVYRPGVTGAWVFGEGREEDRFITTGSGVYAWIPTPGDSLGIRGLSSVGSGGNINSIAVGKVTGSLIPPEFWSPTSLMRDASGILYIADTINNKIRSYDPTTTLVRTYAGTGETPYVDGYRLDVNFDKPYDITQDLCGNFYVADVYNFRVRKISGDTVSTYAGNGVVGNNEGYASQMTTEPRFIKYYNNRIYLTDNTTSSSNASLVRLIFPPPTEVRPSGTRPAGFIIADTSSIPVNVLSRLDVSSTAINNVFQLYKYEPFGGNTFSRVLPGDTLSFARSSGQIITSLTSNADTITFASSNGYQSSFSNLQLIIDVISNSTIVESLSNTVNVGVGRFFPPISNTAYTLYKNEPFTPIRFSTVLPVATPTSSPSLPPGLSFVAIDSNTYDLSGIPLLQSPNSNYLIIGNGTGSNAGKIVTTTISIVVNGERVNLDVSGTLNYTGLSQDVSLNPNTTITARYPAGAIRYTWFPALLPGLKFTDSTGSQQSGNSIFPTDLSGSITLSGAPNVQTIQVLSASQLNSYSVTLTATRFTPLPILTATKTFSFTFNPAVFFDQISSPTIFAGIPIPSNSVYFGAKTVLSTVDTSISDIFLADGALPDGVALTFASNEARAYINGTPSSTTSPSFTLRASNALGVTQDYTTTLTIINDTVTFTNPLVDACYNFIQFKPVSNVTTGWYTYPIQFTASAASLCNVTMTTSDLNGTGLALVSAGSNTFQISGTPTSSKALTTLNVTATAAVSGASAVNSKVKYSISSDVVTINDISLNGIQNRAITPIQFSGSTLSGRPIVSYTSANVPSGLTLSSSGLITGTPTGNGSGTMVVNASTGYSSITTNVPYTITPDSILLIVDQNTYPLVLGGAVPPIEVVGVSYSGIDVSNFQFSNLSPTYGMTINSNTGIFGGTLTDSIPPNVILPASDPFQVKAFAGLLDASLDFTLVTTDHVVRRSFASSFSVTVGSNSIVSYKDEGYTPWTPYLVNPNVNPPAIFYSQLGELSSVGLRSNSLTDQTILFSGLGENAVNGAYDTMGPPQVLRFSNLYSPPQIIDVCTNSDIVISSVVNKPGTTTWWATGGGWSTGSQVCFFSSTDDGLTWQTGNAIDDTLGNVLYPRNDNEPLYPNGNRFYFVGGSILKYKDGVLLAGGLKRQTSLFRSTDEGSTWTAITTQLDSNSIGYISDFNLENSNVWVLLGGLTSNEFTPPFLQYSTDQGQSWSAVVSGDFDSKPKENNVRIGTIAYGCNVWLAECNKKLRFSTDGSNWAACDLSTDTDVFPISPVFFDGSNFNVFAQRDLGTLENFTFTCSPTSDFSFNSWSFSTDSPYGMDSSGNGVSVVLPPSYTTSGPNLSARLDVNAYPPGPTFTGPTTTNYLFNQYVPIPAITISASGVGTVYYFVDNGELPVGLRFDPVTGQITGTPSRTGTTTTRVFAKDNAGITILILTITVIIPRIVRPQSSASAYTSLVRQYTVVNAAQNSRGNRVLTEDGKQGEFMGPMGTDNLIPTNCFICDPNVSSNA